MICIQNWKKVHEENNYLKKCKYMCCVGTEKILNFITYSIERRFQILERTDKMYFGYNSFLLLHHNIITCYYLKVLTL